MTMAVAAMAELRIALIPLDSASRNLSDIVLAELSSEPDVAFLERAEIEKIQKELTLSALSDFVPDPQLMQNTQLFALQKDGQLICFDGVTGVRLLDVLANDPAQAADAMRLAIGKQRSFSGEKLRKLSCMPMVSANLDGKQSERAAKVEELMLRKLSSRPDIALLERRHLMLLLNEPHAMKSKVTERLFAGSLVIKSVAAPAPTKGDLRFTVEFYTADGRNLLKSVTKELSIAGDLNAFSDEFISCLTLPELTATDKAGEASSFIGEAWFSVHNSSLDDAISSAAAAAALDSAYEEELCRISALSAQHLLGAGVRRTSAIIQAGLANLKTSLDIAERQHIFPRELENAFCSLHNYYPEEVKKYFGSHAKELPELIRRGMDCFLESRKPLRDKIALPCENDIQRIVSLETRTYYFNELARYAKVSSDCSYWDKYVLPELETIVVDFNNLLPAITSLDAMPQQERFKLLRNGSEIQRRRLSRVNGFIVFMPLLGDLKFRFLFDPERLDDKWRNAFLRTSDILMSSKLLSLKAIGRYERFLLEINMTTLDAFNRKIDISTQEKQLLDDLIEFMRSTESIIESNRPAQSLLPLLPLECDNFPEEKIIIQELASEKFHIRDYWQGHLVDGHGKWSRKQASMVYSKLLEWEKGVSPDASTNPFTPQRKTLEAKFGFKPPDNFDQKSQLDIFEFGTIRYPLANVKIENHGYGCLLGIENGNLLVVYNRTPLTTTLAAIDIQSGSVCNLQNYQGAIGNFRGGSGSGGIADDFYYAFDGPKCHIFPKDLNQPRKIVEFDQYCPDYNLVRHAAAGNRLYIAFYYLNVNNQSNLIEYNIDTGETKVIASTIDRTVKWPMQDCETAFPLLLKGIDLQKKRLLIQLTGKEYNELYNHYALRLWAYYYDKGTWEPLSQTLPESSIAGCTMLQTEDGRLWLSLGHGLGPLNDQGIWQPEFVLGSNDRIGTRMPNFTSGFNKVPIDYSKLKVQPSPKYDDVNWRFVHFTLYAGNGLFFSANSMYDAKKHEFMRLPFDIQPLVCADGRFLVAHTQGTNFKHLAIIELPEPANQQQF